LIGGFFGVYVGEIMFLYEWVSWMKACVFGRSMAILLNGIPTKEINIQRRLKQGDPLAPFLFLLVAEGFGGVMKNSVRMNLVKGFKFRREGMEISHLKYADDTLCIGEAAVDNLWILKAMLRGFEMVSGLNVSYFKSCLVGVKVSREFMNLACDFLNCCTCGISFK